MERELRAYPTAPLKCWEEAKKLRKKYYEEYFESARQGKGIRVSGSAWLFYALTAGLGDDVYFLTGEPYGATCSYFTDFSVKCVEEAEKYGFARDLCAYMRNYWGSILLNKFILADGRVMDGWPKPTFHFTSHVCCSHAKWYQNAAELEGGDIPLVAIDLPCEIVDPSVSAERKQRVIEYVASQALEAIEKMERITGRKYDDEKLIEAINNETRSEYLWAKICTYNQRIPAVLEEKTMYSLYVFNALCPSRKEVVEFYNKLLEEVQERYEKGIAASQYEQLRIITDSQPPWPFLKVWRYLEREYGVVSVGSLYTFGLVATWEIDEEGNLVPALPPAERGVKMDTREDAVRAYVEFKLKNLVRTEFHSAHAKSEFLKKIVKQWKVDAVFIHLNKGCEGTAIGQMENRLALIEEGIPVLTFEGNMGDHRDFDEIRTQARIEAFLEGSGVKRIK